MESIAAAYWIPPWRGMTAWGAAPLPPLPPKTLDLGHAAVAIGQFHRDRPRLRRELQIRRRVVRNGAGIPGIARRHFQNLVGYRAVDADAHFADRTAIRHQMRVVDQKPVEFAERQPARRGHVEDLALVADQRGLGVEAD